MFSRDEQPRPLKWRVRQQHVAVMPGDTYKVWHIHPFSSDQMIRNLSMKIGDVGLGSIELCSWLLADCWASFERPAMAKTKAIQSQSPGRVDEEINKISPHLKPKMPPLLKTEDRLKTTKWQNHLSPKMSVSNQGRYLCDVHKIFGFYPPPGHIHDSRNLIHFVCFSGTPLPPPTADVI